MNPLTRYALFGLAIALALSLLTNVLLTKKYLSARDAKTQAIADRDSAREAATACSDATEALRELADKRHAASKGEIEAAQTAANDANARAELLRKTKPKFPADDCKSADAQFNDWIASRRKKP